MIHPANRGLEGIRDVCDQVPVNVESFEVDEEGPHPLHEEDQSVEVPTTLLPSTRDKISRWQII